MTDTHVVSEMVAPMSSPVSDLQGPFAAEGAAISLRSWVRDVPDFPAPGILFRDLTGLFVDPVGFTTVLERMRDDAPTDVDVIAGLDARGFIVGAALAIELGVGFIPIRKAGKLPPPVDTVHYDLEYGHAALEMRHGTFHAGQRILVVDDILATGGTAGAAGRLIKSAGGVIAGFQFVLELDGLPGRELLHREFGATTPISVLLNLPA